MYAVAPQGDRHGYHSRLKARTLRAAGSLRFVFVVFGGFFFGSFGGGGRLCFGLSPSLCRLGCLASLISRVVRDLHESRADDASVDPEAGSYDIHDCHVREFLGQHALNRLVFVSVEGFALHAHFLQSLGLENVDHLLVQGLVGFIDDFLSFSRRLHGIKGDEERVNQGQEFAKRSPFAINSGHLHLPVAPLLVRLKVVHHAHVRILDLRNLCSVRLSLSGLLIPEFLEAL
mmetsp:Transcript_30301/g.59337  ORF Transcript_30301/g.59337 Transcript_30301/m.59337 type:complete len:231 (+) Transcript_30301:110-802(+)